MTETSSAERLVWEDWTLSTLSYRGGSVPVLMSVGRAGGAIAFAVVTAEAIACLNDGDAIGSALGRAMEAAAQTALASLGEKL